MLESGPNYRIGRIGFVTEREQITLFFDEDAMDFRRGVAPSGAIVPFGIMTIDGTIAFQLRAGTRVLYANPHLSVLSGHSSARLGASIFGRYDHLPRRQPTMSGCPEWSA